MGKTLHLTIVITRYIIFRSVIIKQGTLRTGKFAVAGLHWGKVKAMRDADNKVCTLL
jgi:translation initiation factor IF-2